MTNSSDESVDDDGVNVSEWVSIPGGPNLTEVPNKPDAFNGLRCLIRRITA